MTITFHIVSDVATLHNDSLIRALRVTPGVRVVTWYALRHRVAPLRIEEGERHVDNHYLPEGGAGLRLLWTALSRPDEIFLLIGYSNLYTKLLLVLFRFSGRSFLYWTDHPEAPASVLRAVLRNAAYRLLNGRHIRLFGAGDRCVKFLVDSGFSRERVTNLPIFVDIPPLSRTAASVRARYGIAPERRLFVGASRLIRNKGFDLLINAVGRLLPSQRARLAILIAGNGPEEEHLKRLAVSAGPELQIVFESWLSAEDYLRVVGAADVFVHPARFDAFGASIFAMALGVPVIGSDAAGAALERIAPGENGLLFPSGDEDALGRCVATLLEDEPLRRSMGKNARQTAESWPPSRGAKIVLDVAREALETR